MSCEQVIIGLEDMRLVRKQRGWTPEKGWGTNMEWRGTTGYLTLINQLIESGAVDIQVTEPVGEGQGEAIVTARYADAALSNTMEISDSENWDLSENKHEIELHLYNYYIAQSEAQIKVILKAKHLLDVDGIDPTYLEDNKESELGQAYTDLGAQGQIPVDKYIEQRALGVSSYTVSIPVITLTKYRSNRSAVQESITGSNRSVEYSDIGLPADISWEEPTFYDEKTGEYKSYDWLKNHPSVTFDGRRSVIQQTWEGHWYLSNLLYGGTGYNF